MKKLITLSMSLLIIGFFACCKANDLSGKSYLLRPTGQYQVGFEDFHWINKSICPDPNFNFRSKSDFSPNNQAHCHEMMVRIYYPTLAKTLLSTSYYPPLIKSQQEFLKEVPGIRPEKIQQLDQIKSYVIEKALVIADKKFPVLIFSPGFGMQAQAYENIINQLVSHGYIVVGVNTIFVNGNIQLPNGHVVKTAVPNSREEGNRIFLPLQIQDLSFVFERLHKPSLSNPVFQSMDMQQIGIFGHSIGARAVATLVQQHPHWFKAAATLDIASYTDEPIRKFSIPFMHEISAYWRSYFSWPLVFKLGKNGYLVTLSPSLDNKYYSYHLNYSDYATLRYLPVYQAYLSHEKEKKQVGVDIKLLSHTPTIKEQSGFINPTYVLVRGNKKWSFLYYEHGKNTGKFGTDVVAHLDAALAQLPAKPLEKMTAMETKPVREALDSFYAGYGNFLGTGNGWTITNSISTYLIQFFNVFLKNEKNLHLENCTALTKDTLLQCGSNIMKN